MFPVSIDGEIALPALEPRKESVLGVLLNVERALVAEKAKNLHLTGNRYSFEAGIFRFVSNWNVLVSVGYGEIEVFPGNPGKLKYVFSCRQMLVCTTAMASIMGAFAGLGSRESSISGAFTVFLFVWAWLFGMNYLIAAIRLPRFVRRAVGV